MGRLTKRYSTTRTNGQTSDPHIKWQAWDALISLRLFQEGVQMLHVDWITNCLYADDAETVVRTQSTSY
jgi:hypothetical protein